MLICQVLAIGFIASLISKLRNLDEFYLACAGYPAVGVIGITYVAWTIISIETAAAIALLTPWSAPIGALAALIWIAVATTAVAVRRARGEVSFRCGCGTDLDKHVNATWLIYRNIVLMMVILVVLWSGVADIVTPADIIPSLLTALSIVLNLALLRSAARTWQEVTEWRTPG